MIGAAPSDEGAALLRLIRGILFVERGVNEVYVIFLGETVLCQTERFAEISNLSNRRSALESQGIQDF